MKLIVQIPCFNEEANLARTVAAIPRDIPGVDAVEILVIDDGSTDRTGEVARRAGADHVVRHRRNRGLARAFRTGIDTALTLGADVIVNTDADGQYPGSDIPALIAPILAGEADIVVGDRSPHTLPHFSWTKRQLQRLGSFVVRTLSQTGVRDAVSGFRALSRDAAMRINIVSPFSYTIEMLIQAGRQRLAVTSLPVGAHPTRQSRLAASIPSFIGRSLTTTVRVYTMHHPLRVFAVLGGGIALVGLLPIVRFLSFYAEGRGAGNVQSLVLGGSLLVIGFVTLLIGVVADLIAFNRQLVELLLEHVRRVENAATRDSEKAERAADAPAGVASKERVAPL